MDQNKYVITEDNDVIIFSPALKHEVFKSRNPISAGFVYLNVEDGKITAECFGSSVSLGLESRPSDSELVTRRLFRRSFF